MRSLHYRNKNYLVDGIWPWYDVNQECFKIDWKASGYLTNEISFKT